MNSSAWISVNVYRTNYFVISSATALTDLMKVKQRVGYAAGTVEFYSLVKYYFIAV